MNINDWVKIKATNQIGKINWIYTAADKLFYIVMVSPEKSMAVRAEGLTLFTLIPAELMDFVANKHKNQVRKYDKEPYINHVVRVAEHVNQCIGNWPLTVAALCHDLIEDTDCTYEELSVELLQYFTRIDDVTRVVGLVRELTDVYDKTIYTELNRRTRKRLEAQRLHNISGDAQTIKYCDLLDNTTSIVAQDKKFAVTYINEKDYILKYMNKGNWELYKLCIKRLNAAITALNI